VLYITLISIFLFYWLLQGFGEFKLSIYCFKVDLKSLSRKEMDDRKRV